LVGVILDVMMSPGRYLQKHEHRGGLTTGLALVDLLLDEKLVSTDGVPRCFVFTHRLDATSERSVTSREIGYYLKGSYMGSALVPLIKSRFEPHGAAT
jgi:hypothetical protein